MKIKCPLCSEEYPTMNDVNGHIIAGHHPEEISEKLLWIIYKIHEKIEHWEDHGISLDLDSDDVVKVLKSLLESEK